MEDKLFFVGLKAFIVNSEGRLLVLRGSHKMEVEGLWGLPGGRIQEGEEATTLEDILRREIKEECGDIEVAIGKPFLVWRFYAPTKNIYLTGYYCIYTQGEVTLSEEHTEYKWIAQQDIAILSFANTYKEIITDFFNKRNLLK
jgi:8-oxo-dGTP diphosphatase